MTVPTWMRERAVQQGRGLRCQVKGYTLACWQVLGALLQMEWDHDWLAECDGCICLEEITLT
jgi:hypothetical protein